MKNTLAFLSLLLSISVHASCSDYNPSKLSLVQLGEELLGPTETATNQYNTIAGIGLLPESVLVTALGDVLKDAGKIKSAKDKLFELCKVIQSKDILQQYFYALNLIYSAPEFALVKENVKMAQFIVNRAAEISADRTKADFEQYGSLNTGVVIRLYKPGSLIKNLGFKLSIKDEELKKSAHIAGIELISEKKAASGGYSYINKNQSLGFKACGYEYLVGVGGETCIGGEGGATSVLYNFFGQDERWGEKYNAYLKVTWKTGQLSIVPIDYRTTSKTTNFDTISISFMVNKNGVYSLIM